MSTQFPSHFRCSRLAALTCVAALCTPAGAASSHKARTPRAASSPSTAQILAPSAATVPDDLPPDKQVYRCGSSYSAHPCSGSVAGPLDVADARSDAQQRQSADLNARDKRLAAWYEAARREREPVASAPTQARRPAAAAACADTTMMTCVPRKPRTRRLERSAASSPQMAGKGKN